MTIKLYLINLITTFHCYYVICAPRETSVLSNSYRICRDIGRIIPILEIFIMSNQHISAFIITTTVLFPFCLLSQPQQWFQ